MPSNKQTKSNKSTVESKVDASPPVVVQTVTKGKKTPAAVAVVAAAVSAAPVVAVEAAPVVVEALEGGAKTKSAKGSKAAKAPVVQKSETASVEKSKGKSKVVKEVADASAAKGAKTPKAAKGVKVAKEAKAPKAAKAAKAPKAAKSDEDSAETEVNSAGKTVRSFKVRLPGNENFEGRFTGLTPYQAANKALSKYYRETEQPKKQIMFSIRESTRGSKRSTYTYNGQREKLKVPVEYAIKDGRTIVKNFKNRLVKVKKADGTDTTTTEVA